MPASAVHVKRTQSQVKPLNTNPNTIIGAALVTAMGPIGVAQVCLSWQDFQNYYGSFSANAQDGPLQIKALFDEAEDEGNVELYVSRVVHCTTSGDPTSKTSAAASLALATASIVASSGANVSANAATWTLAPNQHLDVAVDGGGSALSGTVTTTNGLATITFSGNQTLSAGTVLYFSNQPGVAYYLLSPIVAATAGTLTATYLGTGGAGQTVATSVNKTFTATQAALAGTNAQTFAFTNNWQITFTINATAYPVFTLVTAMFASIGAALASEVVAAFNAYFAANSVPAVATVAAGNKVTVTSNQSGSGSSVSMANTTGTPVTVLGMGTPASGTGNVANIAAVTMAEAISLLGTISGLTASASGSYLALTSNTTGAASSILVVGTSTAVGFNFDNAVHSGVAGGAMTTLTVYGLWDGVYANALSVEILPPTSGSSTEFNVALLQSGVQVESWTNLSMDPASPRYAPYVINGPPTISGVAGANLSGQAASKFIKVVDATLYATNGVPLTLARPAGSVSPATGTTFGPLVGGNDGLAGLADADFVGNISNNGRTGFRVLDLVADMAMILCPGHATAVVANGQINYCEVIRSGLCFAILDTPASQSALGIVSYVQQTAAISEVSEMVAIYWPRIQVDNPNTAIFGQAATVVSGPSGAVAGLCARLDASKEGGAFEHPASIEKGTLNSVRGLEVIGGYSEVLDYNKRGYVFDALINPIMAKQGAVFVDGARTLKDTGPFPTVGESRGVLSVQIALTDALDPKRNQNMRPRFYNEITTKVTNYLKALTRAQCFASNLDATAWYFQMGPSLNTPTVQASRDAIALVGLATSKPAEQIFVTIAPFTSA